MIFLLALGARTCCFGTRSEKVARDAHWRVGRRVRVVSLVHLTLSFNVLSYSTCAHTRTRARAKAGTVIRPKIAPGQLYRSRWGRGLSCRVLKYTSRCGALLRILTEIEEVCVLFRYNKICSMQHAQDSCTHRLYSVSVGMATPSDYMSSECSASNQHAELWGNEGNCLHAGVQSWRKEISDLCTGLKE